MEMRRYESGAVRFELEEPVPAPLHCLVFMLVHLAGPVLWAVSWVAWHLRGRR